MTIELESSLSTKGLQKHDSQQQPSLWSENDLYNII